MKVCDLLKKMPGANPCLRRGDSAGHLICQLCEGDLCNTADWFKSFLPTNSTATNTTKTEATSLKTTTKATTLETTTEVTTGSTTPKITTEVTTVETEESTTLGTNNFSTTTLDANTTDETGNNDLTTTEGKCHSILCRRLTENPKKMFEC